MPDRAGLPPAAARAITVSPNDGTRIAWIDAAKGIGIVLVVFGHAWRGLESAGLIGHEAAFAAVDGMIYAFHMPLFFFLSGLVFGKPWRKRRPIPFALSRAERLVWPLFLWTWIFFAAKMLAADAANQPLAPADFPLWPMPPREHLWFLWALFLLHLAAYGLGAILPATASNKTFGYAGFILAVGLTMVPLPGALGAWIGAAVGHAPYFLAGLLLASARRQPVPWLPSAAAAAIAVAALVTAVIQGHGGLQGLAIAMAVVLALGAVISRFAAARPSSALLRCLCYLGTASMAIYLGHTIFSAGTRIALTSIGVDSLTAHVLLGVTAGLLGPAVLLEGADRLSIRRYLGF